jgi:hypothetical protein
MKTKKPKKSLRLDLRITWKANRGGWAVIGDPGRARIFDSPLHAQDYCARTFGQHAVVETCETRHQELPEASVWTGAPWDRSFKHLK